MSVSAGDHPNYELGPVVTTDVPRRRPAPGDDPVEGGGRGVGGDAPGSHDRQRLPCVLADDVEQLQDPPVHGLAELEVQRLDVVRPLSTQPPGGLSRVPQALTLASLRRDAQPSSRQSRCTRSRFTSQPSSRSLRDIPASAGPVAQTRRHPPAGCPREKACNAVRSASSPPAARRHAHLSLHW